MKTRFFLCSLVLAGWNASPVLAQFDSGSDGSDGAFNPLIDVEIDLSLADGVTPGNGTYDPDHWAVVFNYTTIDIPSGVTVTFGNHPSGAPVIWLASGDVTISGPIRVDGALGQSSGVDVRVAAPGGPGGFHGGFGGSVPSYRHPSGGFGPGGPSIDPDADGTGAGGSYATIGSIGDALCNNPTADLGPTYGNVFLLPLIGGSGGAGSWGTTTVLGAGSGGGGGAILIASSATITLNAVISAEGGNGGGEFPSWGGAGAGGGIRLIGNQIAGTAALLARGGYGCNYYRPGDGRTRVEADLILVAPSFPAFTSGTPGLVLPPLDAPTLVATTVDTQAVPGDPVADVEAVDVSIATENPVTIEIEATDVPVGTTVDVRIVPKRAGNSFVVTSTPLAGALEFSTATAEVTFPPGVSEVQLSAWFAGARGARGPTPPGEKDRRYASAEKGGRTIPRYRRVHAIVGVETGPSPNEMTYLTGDGRKVTYPADLFANTRHMLQAAKSQSRIVRTVSGR